MADPSNGCGIDLTSGRAMLLAKVANEANGVGDVIWVVDAPGDVIWGPSGVIGEEMYKSFIGGRGGEGVLGGGGK